MNPVRLPKSFLLAMKETILKEGRTKGHLQIDKIKQAPVDTEDRKPVMYALDKAKAEQVKANPINQGVNIEGANVVNENKRHTNDGQDQHQLPGKDFIQQSKSIVHRENPDPGNKDSPENEIVIDKSKMKFGDNERTPREDMAGRRKNSKEIDDINPETPVEDQNEPNSDLSDNIPPPCGVDKIDGIHVLGDLKTSSPKKSEMIKPEDESEEHQPELRENDDHDRKVQKADLIKGSSEIQSNDKYPSAFLAAAVDGVRNYSTAEQQNQSDRFVDDNPDEFQDSFEHKDNLHQMVEVLGTKSCFKEKYSTPSPQEAYSNNDPRKKSIPERNVGSELNSAGEKPHDKSPDKLSDEKLYSQSLDNFWNEKSHNKLYNKLSDERREKSDHSQEMLSSRPENCKETPDSESGQLNERTDPNSDRLKNRRSESRSDYPKERSDSKSGLLKEMPEFSSDHLKGNPSAEAEYITEEPELGLDQRNEMSDSELEHVKEKTESKTDCLKERQELKLEHYNEKPESRSDHAKDSSLDHVKEKPDSKSSSRKNSKSTDAHIIRSFFESLVGRRNSQDFTEEHTEKNMSSPRQVGLTSKKSYVAKEENYVNFESRSNVTSPEEFYAGQRSSSPEKRSGERSLINVETSREIRSPNQSNSNENFSKPDCKSSKVKPGLSSKVSLLRSVGNTDGVKEIQKPDDWISFQGPNDQAHPDPSQSLSKRNVDNSDLGSNLLVSNDPVADKQQNLDPDCKLPLQSPISSHDHGPNWVNSSDTRSNLLSSFCPGEPYQIVNNSDARPNPLPSGEPREQNPERNRAADLLPSSQAMFSKQQNSNPDCRFSFDNVRDQKKENFQKEPSVLPSPLSLLSPIEFSYEQVPKNQVEKPDDPSNRSPKHLDSPRPSDADIQIVTSDVSEHSFRSGNVEIQVKGSQHYIPVAASAIVEVSNTSDTHRNMDGTGLKHGSESQSQESFDKHPSSVIVKVSLKRTDNNEKDKLGSVLCQDSLKSGVTQIIGNADPVSNDGDSAQSEIERKHLNSTNKDRSDSKISERATNCGEPEIVDNPALVSGEGSRQQTKHQCEDGRKRLESDRTDSKFSECATKSRVSQMADNSDRLLAEEYLNPTDLQFGERHSRLSSAGNDGSDFKISGRTTKSGILDEVDAAPSSDCTKPKLVAQQTDAESASECEKVLTEFLNAKEKSAPPVPRPPPGKAGGRPVSAR